MQVQVNELRTYLQSFDFPRLFVEGLGWDYYQAEPLALTVESHKYLLKPVAEKAGFGVFECAPGPEGAIPDYPARRRIETEVAKRVFEHLIIFVDAQRTRQVWQWVKREAGKRATCREHQFHTGQTGLPLLQRLNDFIFTLEDEVKGIGIGDVARNVGKAFDVEKVTRRFYDRFRTELTAFGNFIEGITAQGDRDWYASLMLNRMMFVYFIQKKGFLDDDTDYLRNKLDQVRWERGQGKFQLFYYEFLRRLFHEGLGQPKARRSPDLEKLLGKVPFLNGGLFDVHDLERDNPDIAIPDEAFERVFDFFDSYRWHLDERPYREDNEINPDVLGYIFEKYVNQKQMGAYYTKEDITGYISRNTVIPFLFDAAKKECPVAFGPEGGVWRLLQDDPDRYIYPAVGHGIAWNARQPEAPARLDSPFDLPEDIAAGVNDVSRRGGWNAPAPEEYALPTETWREVVARRARYHEVRDKLAAGEVSEVNDLITLNLDLERFARDVIALSEGSDLLTAFWRSLYGNRERTDAGISVLDPTCGSGAFLFAALNILEPLYTACLEGMRGFLDDMERSARPRNPNRLSHFRDVLAQVEKHPNERYFILKSIVLNNLYGVDIMEEAVEICKLRLFLKLAAQLESYDRIEPLPDIDFNIRAGNTLVGFTSLDAVSRAMTITETQDRPRPEVRRAVRGQQIRSLDEEQQEALQRIEDKGREIAREYGLFQWIQTTFGMDAARLAQSKRDLRDKLKDLGGELDALLSKEYGVDPKKAAAYDAWRASHRPFHWFVEFYGIMSRGGFDVVIGNPPYLEFKEVDYQMRGYACLDTRAIHALCIERSATLIDKLGCMSMIVPLALPSTQRMKAVQDILEVGYRNVWYGNFAWRPAKLFDTVNRALTIFTVTPSESPQSSSTAYQKWTSDSREGLFDLINYEQVPRDRLAFWVPKIGTTLEHSILKKLISIPTSVADFVGKTDHRIFYRTTGGLYWKVFTDFAPAFSVNGRVGRSSRETNFSVRHRDQAKPIIASLSSDVFWWWYTITSNLRDMNPTDINGFPIPESIFSDVQLAELGGRYLDSLQANSRMMTRHQKQTGTTETQSFVIKESKPIIDEIDRALAEHYGFTEEEMDFIINYDIKYRMGRS